MGIHVRRILVERDQDKMSVRRAAAAVAVKTQPTPPEEANKQAAQAVSDQQQPTQDQSYQQNLPQAQAAPEAEDQSGLAPLPPGQKQPNGIPEMAEKLKAIGMEPSQVGTVYTLGFIKSGLFPKLKEFLAQNKFQVALDDNKKPFVRSGWNYWHDGNVVVGYKAGAKGKYTFGLTIFLYKDLYE